MLFERMLCGVNTPKYVVSVVDANYFTKYFGVEAIFSATPVPLIPVSGSPVYYPDSTPTCVKNGRRVSVVRNGLVAATPIARSDNDAPTDDYAAGTGFHPTYQGGAGTNANATWAMDVNDKAGATLATVTHTFSTSVNSNSGYIVEITVNQLGKYEDVRAGTETTGVYQESYCYSLDRVLCVQVTRPYPTGLSSYGTPKPDGSGRYFRDVIPVNFMFADLAADMPAVGDGAAAIYPLNTISLAYRNGGVRTAGFIQDPQLFPTPTGALLVVSTGDLQSEAGFDVYVCDGVSVTYAGSGSGVVFGAVSSRIGSILKVATATQRFSATNSFAPGSPYRLYTLTAANGLADSGLGSCAAGFSVLANPDSSEFIVAKFNTSQASFFGGTLYRSTDLINWTQPAVNPAISPASVYSLYFNLLPPIDGYTYSTFQPLSS